MKAILFVFASILFALAMATHVPGHATPPKLGKHPKFINAENRVLMSDFNGRREFDGGDGNIGGGNTDDIGGTGDFGGVGDGDNGGFGDGDDGGVGNGDDGGVGGAGGYRALRGLGDELASDGAINGNYEVVVAGGTVVRGGAVVARPRPRRGPWY